MLTKLKGLLKPEFLRWYAVGFVFTAFGLVLLKFMKGFGWPDWAATFIQAEVCNILRFLIVDRWVFKHPKPTWKRLWQYHIANAAGFAVWWSVTFVLDHMGVYYLLAPILASGASVGLSIATNFLWIWKKPKVTAV